MGSRVLVLEEMVDAVRRRGRGYLETHAMVEAHERERKSTDELGHAVKLIFLLATGVGVQHVDMEF